MDPEEFIRDKTIDPSQLDVEAARQAETFFKWAERAIEAKALTDRLRLRLEVLEARLGIQCREKPDEFGLSRVTEMAIVAAVKTHQDYITAYKKYLAAKADSSMLDRAVDAMDMKKRMIESLITLHGQQYFAGPSVPRNLVEAWKETQVETEKAVNARQKLRPRKRGEKRKGKEDV